jgi:hypothetical protein
MSMEQNEPQSSQGQQQGPPTVPVSASADGATPGQNGQRRRRRRRKTGRVAGPPEALPANQTPDASAESATPLPRQQSQPPSQDREQFREQRQAPGGPDSNRDQRPRPGHSQQHHGKKQQRQAKGGSGGGSSQGRQFQKGSPPQPVRESNPGNGIGQPPGGARRKNKVRRAAPTFVGPMDHSYRAVNGNIADGSPSTMDYRSNTVNGNGNGNVHGRNGYLDAAEIAAPALLRDDAPVRIICFIEDLFVVAKLQETARKLGVKIGFAKAEKDTVTKLMETPEAERPSLIVFDLNNVNAKPLTLIPKLKAKLKRATSVIGFLSHIQGDLKVKAIEAGCDMVMPKSAFSQNLPNLLRRHGLDEELEAVEV